MMNMFVSFFSVSCPTNEQGSHLWMNWSPITADAEGSHQLCHSWISTWPCLSLKWQELPRFVPTYIPGSTEFVPVCFKKKKKKKFRNVIKLNEKMKILSKYFLYTMLKMCNDGLAGLGRTFLNVIMLSLPVQLQYLITLKFLIFL